MVSSTDDFTHLLEEAKANNRLVLLIGNGGSLVNALHLELHLQEAGIRATSITNPAILSARSNDYGINLMFSPSVSALGRKGDILIAISGSGKSPNILQACKAALARGMVVIGISFTQNSPLLKLASYPLYIPSNSMAQFEDDVSTLCHLMKGEIE